MHKITQFAFLLVLTVTRVYAGAPFNMHNFEVSLTPGADAFFFTHTERTPDYKSLEEPFSKPGFGFSLCMRYTFRPIRYLGISAGVDFIEQGIRINGGSTDYVFNNQFNNNNNYTSPVLINFNGHEFNGYLGVPVFISGYVPIKRVELQLATGPEFVLPLYSSEKYTTTSADSTFNISVNRTNHSSAAQIKQESWLGWAVQLTVNIPLKNSAAIEMGPDIRFISVYPLDAGPYYNNIPHRIDYLAGCKIGFRFGGRRDKVSKPVEAGEKKPT